MMGGHSYVSLLELFVVGLDRVGASAVDPCYFPPRPRRPRRRPPLPRSPAHPRPQSQRSAPRPHCHAQHSSRIRRRRVARGAAPLLGRGRGHRPSPPPLGRAIPSYSLFKGRISMPAGCSTSGGSRVAVRAVSVRPVVVDGTQSRSPIYWPEQRRDAAGERDFRRLIMKSSTHHTNAPRSTSEAGSQ